VSGLTTTRSEHQRTSNPRWRRRRGAGMAAVSLTLSVGAATMLAPVPARAVDSYNTDFQAVVQAQGSLSSFPSQYHRALPTGSERSTVDGASTLGGVLKDSLGSAVSGATISVDPPGAGCGQDATASTTTGSDGSFSVSVSPGSYNVEVSYGGSSAVPDLDICTGNVDLSTSVNDTLTLPVTQLTVTAKDSSGALLQGATIPRPGEYASLAQFDLFPGQPTTSSEIWLGQSYTTAAAGTAVIPFMPLTSPLTLTVDPPAGSGLAPTTINTGLMTTSTAVTATLGFAYSVSGTVTSSASGKLAGQTVTLSAVHRKKGIPAVARAVTNSEGFYGFVVPAGEYRLQLSGGKTNSGSLPYRYKIKTGVFSLTFGEVLNLTLPVVNLRVTVKNQTGKTLPGVKISTHCTATPVSLARHLPASGISCGLATTNSSGVADLSILATPSINITATPGKRYEPVTKKYVDAERSTSLSIVVRPERV
jgi:Carboxypeptidase regulatory-like domain